MRLQRSSWAIEEICIIKWTRSKEGQRRQEEKLNSPRKCRKIRYGGKWIDIGQWFYCSSPRTSHSSVTIAGGGGHFFSPIDNFNKCAACPVPFPFHWLFRTHSIGRYSN